jgi:anti-sigma B factor antagonist
MPMVLENMQIVANQGSREGLKVLVLKGPLSIHTVFSFQEAIRTETSPAVIIDFSGVPFIDSAGLGALVSAHISARKANRKIAFAAMNEQARALIEMTHINKLFFIYPSIQEAEAAIA